MPHPSAASVIPAEVAHFDALAEDWWDPDGPMAPLHRLTPLRVAWARDLLVSRFHRDARCGAPLAGLEVLDIGCGAGLFAEPLARLGATVEGIDPAPAPIEAARRHAEETGARVTYRVATVEALREEPRRFDVVSAMEVVEHVADPARFVADAAALMRPGGLFLASTLNRTLKSFALAIVGAEYVLRWLDSRDASLGAVRDAGGIRRRGARRRLESDRPPGRRLRSVAPRLAPVARHERELPVRREKAVGRRR